MEQATSRPHPSAVVTSPPFPSRGRAAFLRWTSSAARTLAVSRWLGYGARATGGGSNLFKPILHHERSTVFDHLRLNLVRWTRLDQHRHKKALGVFERLQRHLEPVIGGVPCGPIFPVSTLEPCDLGLQIANKRPIMLLILAHFFHRSFDRSRVRVPFGVASTDISPPNCAASARSIRKPSDDLAGRIHTSDGMPWPSSCTTSAQDPSTGCRSTCTRAGSPFRRPCFIAFVTSSLTTMASGTL